MKQKLLVLTLCSSMVNPAFAAIKTIGKGETIQFDTSKLSAQMKANYEIMKVKCVKCHTLERTVVALSRGVAPITGMPFDRNAVKAYGVKMRRKPDSNMNSQEIKACVDLMNCLLDEANH